MTKVEKEINDQKTELKEVYRWMRKRLGHETLYSALKGADIVYFVGCGSSYYLGMSASRYLTLKTGIETKAIPGGEVIFAEDANISKNLRKAAVLISRSGESTEVVVAAKHLKRKGIPTIGITLDESSSLAKVTDYRIVIPIVEESIVMTKAFTSMLLSLQLLADSLAGADTSDVYENLLEKIECLLEESYKEVAEKALFTGSHYVFLGTGVYEGIARESALKLEEMALAKTEAYSTFEYRHGPKALVEEGVVVLIFKGGGNEEGEEKLRAELEGYGGKVVMKERLAKGSEDVFLKPIFSQILALKIAETKGVDVEHPRNLGKVVVLDD